MKKTQCLLIITIVVLFSSCSTVKKITATNHPNLYSSALVLNTLQKAGYNASSIRLMDIGYNTPNVKWVAQSNHEYIIIDMFSGALVSSNSEIIGYDVSKGFTSNYIDYAIICKGNIIYIIQAE